MRHLKLPLLMILLSLPVALPAQETPGPAVAEATICLDVVDRVAVGATDAFPADVGSLVCLSRITGAANQEIIHAWIHGGRTKARVRLSVGADSWRCWSRKTILPTWTGYWELKIMTVEGEVLETIPFIIKNSPKDSDD